MARRTPLCAHWPDILESNKSLRPSRIKSRKHRIKLPRPMYCTCDAALAYLTHESIPAYTPPGRPLWHPPAAVLSCRFAENRKFYGARVGVMEIRRRHFGPKPSAHAKNNAIVPKKITVDSRAR